MRTTGWIVHPPPLSVKGIFGHSFNQFLTSLLTADLVVLRPKASRIRLYGSRPLDRAATLFVETVFVPAGTSVPFQERGPDYTIQFLIVKGISGHIFHQLPVISRPKSVSYWFVNGYGPLTGQQHGLWRLFMFLLERPFPCGNGPGLYNSKPPCQGGFEIDFVQILPC